MRLDQKPSFVLALGKAFILYLIVQGLLMMKISQVLHPYYKLAYIKLSWGGPKEQAAEVEQGNLLAKDWHDEAKKIVEKTVRCSVPHQ